FDKENDNSCVVQVLAAGQSALLTGDIEQAAERWLVAAYGGELSSRLLLAPHHAARLRRRRYFWMRSSPIGF
uniref:hypothetical protein n=1 Tax=Methylomonas koyamae TaxID=702114 RepID=UPI00210F44F9